MIINIQALGNIHSHVVSTLWMIHRNELLFFHLRRLDRHLGQVILESALVNELREQILDAGAEIMIDIAHVI